MRYFMVVSDRYEMTHGSMESGPPEYGHDVWEGEARNRNHARLLALKEWSKQRNSTVDENRSDNRHPMSGARVLEWLPCEIHGDVQCEKCVYVEDSKMAVISAFKDKQ